MKPKDITKFLISFFLIFVLFGSTANASIIELDYSFILTTVGTNPYDLNDGDILTVDITIDEAYGAEAGDLSTHSRTDDDLTTGNTADPYFAMSFDFGNKPEPFTEEDDIEWTVESQNWPAVTVSIADPSVMGIFFIGTDGDNMISIDNVNGVPTLTASDVDLSWSITGTPVPEPTTLALFGLGLFSLAGICRKRSLK